MPFLPNKEDASAISILDLGCGNGRFLSFLDTSVDKSAINYTGVDNNQALLSKAGDSSTAEHTKTTLYQLDIINSLQKNELITAIESISNTKKYDVVVSLGFLHHIPSKALRTKFIEVLYQVTQPEGIVVLAFWQPMKSDRMRAKRVDPSKVSIKTADLEPGDTILDWKRGAIAYRYCHHFSDQEIEEYFFDTNWQILTSFAADGKEKLNKYVVLQKNH